MFFKYVFHCDKWSYLNKNYTTKKQSHKLIKTTVIRIQIDYVAFKSERVDY